MLLLILLKVFKSASMETSYFTNLFYLKDGELCIQKMKEKKISKVSKRQGKRLKAIKKNHINKP